VEAVPLLSLQRNSHLSLSVSSAATKNGPQLKRASSQLRASFWVADVLRYDKACVIDCVLPVIVPEISKDLGLDPPVDLLTFFHGRWCSLCCAVACGAPLLVVCRCLW
jgi:hypothetical protein